jgi:hypothetical protein
MWTIQRPFSTLDTETQTTTTKYIDIGIRFTDYNSAKKRSIPGDKITFDGGANGNN